MGKEFKPLTGSNIFGYQVKITTVENDWEVYGFLYLTATDPIVKREIGFIWDRFTDEVRIEKACADNAFVYTVVRGAIAMLQYVFDEAKGDFQNVIGKVVKEGKDPAVAQQEIAHEKDQQATIDDVLGHQLASDNDDDDGAPPGGWAH